MISQNISPVYVNRAYQNWTANGGVYGDGGVHYQSSGTAPTLDLQFAGETAISSQVTFTRASTGTYYNSAGVLSSAAVNEARLDYNPSTLAAQGLLIEEARTNLATYSEALGNALGWSLSAGLIVTSNVITAPDGTISADQLASSGATGFLEKVVAITSGTTYTFSCFFKKQNTSTVSILLYGTHFNSGGANVTGTYNLDTGVATTANGTASMVSVGNGWYRCVLTKDATTSGSFSQQAIRLANATADLYAWGYQIEAGAFPTSYIPTTTTALTRAADVASVNTLSPWYNATEGTLYAEGTLVGGAASTFPYPTVLVGSNVNNDSIGVGWTANAGIMRFGVRAGGVAQADLAAGSAKSANSSYKVAGRYATNNVQAAFDGTLGTLDTAVTVPTIATLSLGGAAGFQPAANTWLRRVTYYPTSLSNAQLQAITT